VIVISFKLTPLRLRHGRWTIDCSELALFGFVPILNGVVPEIFSKKVIDV